jgi:UDP-3-O-[3-hydroxymyristoyl] N-acetylglucosamine deacetylase/UDP-3-O-[3-hydroxymyristoyl] N-acetylglucosamine deacetylase/3-hydroxyacyl-[acyl-carrier-protein] dehydratase
MRQKTIGNPVSCSGIGVSGQYCSTLTFEPAPVNTGIIFVRADLPESPEIPCCPEYAKVEARWTSLVKGDIRIEHTEHLLAALAGLGIDNIRIVLNGPEVPVVSGFSSGKFVQILLQAKILPQEESKRVLAVKEPVAFTAEFFYGEMRYERIMLALPAPQLALTYLLDYPSREIPVQSAHFVFEPAFSFTSELAPARSFIMKREYEMVAGLIGKGIEDCLIFSGEPPKLSWENEPARHKVLDLLGDLYIMGYPIKGHFIGIRTGHKDNIRMCRNLARQFEGRKA